jgi:hypothetical protein
MERPDRKASTVDRRSWFSIPCGSCSRRASSSIEQPQWNAAGLHPQRSAPSLYSTATVPVAKYTLTRTC